MSILGKKIKYWCQLLLLPLYGLSLLFPRNKNIWVFGSTFGRRFADNPKYFYLYLSEQKADKIKAIWISKNKDVVKFLTDNKRKAYYLYSFLGIWYCLRAKVYLFDNYSKDICFTLSGGAIKINLWHGIPLKKIQKDNKFDKVRNPRNIKERLTWYPRRISDEKPSHYVLTTSQFLKPIFASAFHTERVLVCGYPRNEVLINEHIENILEKSESQLLKKLEDQGKNYKIVLYMPTFRDSETKFFDIISIKEFEDYLIKNNMIFCVKLHPKSRLQKEFQEAVGSGIVMIDSQADPYPLLKLADILVTDYSSIYFDFLLTQKPIVFFPYDFKEYLMESRELYFDYNKFTPGSKVYDQEGLEKALLNVYKAEDEAGLIRSKVFDESTFTASENLYSIICNIVRIKNKE